MAVPFLSNPPRPLRLLADAPVALLWAGLATSALGEQLFTVVLSWVAVGAFGAAAGYLTALQAGVLVAVALAAGSWADRRRQTAVMIGADLARAVVLLATVAAWLAGGHPPAWSLIACMFVLGGGVALFRPAMQATLPPLVRDRGVLPAANALFDATDRIARLIAPAMVGFTAALIPLVHFVTLDAATFLASAVAVASVVRLRPAEPRPPQHETVLAGIRRGFAAIGRHRLLRYCLCTTGPISGASAAAYFLGLPLMIGQGSAAGSGLAAFGLVMSAYGSSNLLGTLMVGSRTMPRHPERLIFAGNCLFGLGVLLLATVGLVVAPAWRLPAFCAAAAISALGGPMQDIMVATLRQTELPAADIAAAVRTFAVVGNLGLLATLAMAPTLFVLLGVPPAVLLCGATYVGVGGLGLMLFRNASPTS
jgi:hypothetical protein